MKKYLHFDWHSFSGEFLWTEFEALGFESIVIDHATNYLSTPENLRKEEQVLQNIRETLLAGKIEFVFSFNYFSALGVICNELGIKYISYIYDSPWAHLDNASVFYDTNFIFSFDSLLFEQAKARGAKSVYYLPLFSHPEFFDSLKLTDKLQKKYKADIAFVGALYDQNAIQKYKKGINSEYFSGYIDGIINAQKGAYGLELITASYSEDFLKCLNKLDKMGAFPRSRVMGLHAVPFVDGLHDHIVRMTAHLERIEIIEMLSENYDFKLYTKSPGEYLSDSVQNMGGVDTFFEAPLVYRQTLINLNLTHHGIMTGIPLRCFDIMAAGGFLLSNFQKDFELHFTEGTDYAAFSSEEELFDKINYYLSHESARKMIAKSGYEKIKKYHTARNRAVEMLTTAGVI